MVNRGQDPPTRLQRMGKSGTHEQNCRTYLEVRAIVTDHSLENFGMQKRAIKKGGKSLFEDHSDQSGDDG